MIVLDTDHLSEVQRRESRRGVELCERLEKRGDRPVATTIVSIEEQLRGRLAGINQSIAGTGQVLPYARLTELLKFYSGWIVLPFDQLSAQHFHELHAGRIRIGTMDLKIAAIVRAHQGTLLSANLRDFRQVPGLVVEDWLATE
jgi:tRNA(fMet)-specific endonuclease VapC